MPQKPKNPDWKQDLDFALSKGLTLHQACRHANVSPSTAYHHGYESSRKLISDYHDVITEMVQKRISARIIAEKLGFSTNAIHKYCRICEVPKPKSIKDYHHEIVEMRKKRYSYDAIAECFGVSAQTIGNYCRLHGIKKG